MLGLKLNHVSKRGHRRHSIGIIYIVILQQLHQRCLWNVMAIRSKVAGWHMTIVLFCFVIFIGVFFSCSLLTKHFCVTISLSGGCWCTIVWQTDTVECRYNVVQYCKILHKWLQELRQNISEILDSQRTHTPKLVCKGELWGVVCEYLWENWPWYNGTALFIWDVH